MPGKVGIGEVAEDTGTVWSRDEGSKRAGIVVSISGTYDDRQLVEQALRNRDSYAFIVRRYQPMLHRYVQRLLGSFADAAQDVLQDVFIKAYINLNDYDRSRPFGPWIYRIAHNEAVSFLRKKKAEPPQINGEDAELIFARMSDGENPDSKLSRSIEAGKVRAALARLSPRYRDVLVLRYLEEKSYDDIADILELPLGTVATLINRGLKQLKAPLRESWSGTVRS